MTTNDSKAHWWNRLANWLDQLPTGVIDWVVQGADGNYLDTSPSREPICLCTIDSTGRVERNPACRARMCFWNEQVDNDTRREMLAKRNESGRPPETGGYPSGDTPASQLRPPPANMTSPQLKPSRSGGQQEPSRVVRPQLKPRVWGSEQAVPVDLPSGPKPREWNEIPRGPKPFSEMIAARNEMPGCALCDGLPGHRDCPTCHGTGRIPPLPRQLVVPVPYDLLLSLVGDEPCRYDHNGDCQEHWYFGLDGDTCPHSDGRALLRAHDEKLP